MSLFKKPSELQAKPGIAALIYGTPGVGKSTLACSAPGAVMIDTDGGVMRMNGAHMVPTLQVKSWEEIVAAMQELRQSPDVQTVIIDTVGKMVTFMEDYIKRTAKRGDLKADGTLNLPGYGRRKNMFNDFTSGITVLGKNVLYVGHGKEDRRGDDVVIRPDVGSDSLSAELFKDLDIVGYMEMTGSDRTISFTPEAKFYAKNTCDMPGVIKLPVLIDQKGEAVANNDFFAGVVANFRARQARAIENNQKEEQLRDLIDGNAESIVDAATAMQFCDWVQGLEHVYRSKAYAGEVLKKKVKALGLVWDNEKKAYVDKV